jgi:DNA-binding NarL/FixJ family response regulator
MGGVLVVDDHLIIAKACHLVLDFTDFGNVISAFDSESGYAAFFCSTSLMNVAIVDLSLHKDELGGLALIKRIRSHDQDARILVFSMHAASERVASSIEAGAMGYLIKDSLIDELKKAVQQVRLGRRYVAPQLAIKLVFPDAALVAREKEVLTLLMEGTPYETIAARLGIRSKTVADLPRKAKGWQ